MTMNEQQGMRLDVWRRTARGVGGVALIFSIVVGVLLTTDWMRTGQAQTVRSDQLSQVEAAARQSPGDAPALAAAREWDQAARHAYFSSTMFRNTGTWMLILGLLTAVASLRAAVRLGRRIDDPRRFPATDQARADREARLALLAAGGGALLLLSVWSIGHSPALPSAAPSPQPVVPVAKTSAVSAAAATIGVVSSYWCCFRGPNCGVAGWTNAPTAWDGKTGAGVLWRTPLDKPGVSSPVLWGGKLFLTVADETAREVVAYDVETGIELWRQVVADGGQGEALPETSADTGLAASTAACDGSAVYAIFGTGDLVAYAHDGKLLWQVYLHRPDKSYGHASSLWAEDGKVCVQYDQKQDGRVLVVDGKTGKTIWEKSRINDAAWSSPVVVAGVDGRRVLAVNAPEKLDGYDFATGAELWSVEGVAGEVAPSPACWNGRIMIVNAFARLVCYELASKPVKLWESTDALPDVASPVAANGLLFLALSSGQVACLDATDGKMLWNHDYRTGFYASPVVCGDRFYALDRDGTMRILAAERAFRQIASCPLGDAGDATPAFADGRIYVRGRSALWCIGGR